MYNSFPVQSHPLTDTEKIILKYLVHQLINPCLPWALAPIANLLQDSISRGNNEELHPIVSAFRTLLQSQLIDIPIDWSDLRNTKTGIQPEMFLQKIETWRKKAQDNWTNARVKKITDLELYQFFIDRLSGRVNAQGEWQIPFSFPDLYFPTRPLIKADENTLIKVWGSLRTVSLTQTGQKHQRTILRLHQITEELQSRNLWDSQGLQPLVKLKAKTTD